MLNLLRFQKRLSTRSSFSAIHPATTSTPSLHLMPYDQAVENPRFLKYTSPLPILASHKRSIALDPNGLRVATVYNQVTRRSSWFLAASAPHLIPYDQAVQNPDLKFRKYASQLPILASHKRSIAPDPNGLRVATVYNQVTRRSSSFLAASAPAKTSTVGVWINAGSWLFSEEANGTAYFLMKSNQRFGKPSARGFCSETGKGKNETEKTPSSPHSARRRLLRILLFRILRAALPASTN